MFAVYATKEDYLEWLETSKLGRMTIWPEWLKKASVDTE
jgi:hypothetical protein